MKYKIEIWRYHGIIETYESDNISDVLKWYRNEWQYAYDMGACYFEVNEFGRKMTFEELDKLKFYD